MAYLFILGYIVAMVIFCGSSFLSSLKDNFGPGTAAAAPFLVVYVLLFLGIVRRSYFAWIFIVVLTVLMACRGFGLIIGLHYAREEIPHSYVVFLIINVLVLVCLLKKREDFD